MGNYYGGTRHLLIKWYISSARCRRQSGVEPLCQNKNTEYEKISKTLRQSTDTLVNIFQGLNQNIALVTEHPRSGNPTQKVSTDGIDPFIQIEFGSFRCVHHLDGERPRSSPSKKREDQLEAIRPIVAPSRSLRLDVVRALAVMALPVMVSSLALIGLLHLHVRIFPHLQN
ncbi:hypothetical protein RRG08_010531 [Elysia crispata]|uniref:Uncharacterized protein n=1 Tax=Elysia crispata TaxID=231223 RepID=A0AAE1E1R6_9GAST|nr:hypothetical protein RRG08_010531 [Elysia crispata]